MKTKLILTGLLLAAGLFTFTSFKAPAQGNPGHKHYAVILQDQDTWHRGSNQEYIQTGLQVSWIDGSDGAPTVPIGSSLSAAIAYYMDLGFSHELISARKHLFKR
jgi:hypothetical protein